MQSMMHTMQNYNVYYAQLQANDKLYYIKSNCTTLNYTTLHYFPF